MVKNKKIFFGILVVIILISGWWVWKSQTIVHIGICGPKGMGWNYDVSYCDKSCNADNDCMFTCGCGDINKNEICHDEGIIYDCVNHEVKCEKGKCVIGEEVLPTGVTITTDKTEYNQGETVKITVQNGLDKSIWDFTSCGGKPFWDLQKFDDGRWQSLDVDLPQLEGEDWICYLKLCETQEPVQLKLKSEITDEWHINFFCNFIDENGHLLDEAEMISVKEGTYRLVLTYGLDNEYVNKNTIYSNEFIIKEK